MDEGEKSKRENESQEDEIEEKRKICGGWEREERYKRRGESER